MKEINRNQIRNIIFDKGKLVNEQTGELFLNVDKSSIEEVEGIIFDLYATSKMAKSLYSEVQEYFIETRKPRKDNLHFFTLQNRKDRRSLEIEDISARREYEKLESEVEKINQKVKERKKKMKEIEERHGKFKYNTSLKIRK